MMLLIVAGIILLTAGCIEKPGPEVEMVLSNYPKLFEKDVIIVVGENATQIEMEGAQAIAENLGGLTGNVPVIKKDIEITEIEETGYNLIIIGSPEENKLLREVYERTNATKVTKEYPGAGKGVLEIMRSLWNERKTILLVDGRDEQGIRAGSKTLEQVIEVDKKRITVEWNVSKPIFMQLVSIDKYVFIEMSQEISGLNSRIDRPDIYSFNNTTGFLYGGNFIINDNLVSVIGNRIKVNPPGGGASGGIIPIYETPTPLNIPFLLKIIFIEKDGTVHLIYGDSKLILKPGEELDEKFSTEWMGQKIKVESKFKNYGLQDKDKIKLWN